MERRILLRLIGISSLQLFSSRLLGQNRRKYRRVIEFEHSARDVILDQSGNFGMSHFVIGILTCSDIEGTVRELKKIRSRSKYRYRLHYHHRNKYKAAFAKKLIDYWLGSSTINIRVRAIKQTKKMGRERPIDKDLRYINHLAGLLNTRPVPSATSRLVTQRRYASESKSQEVHRRLKQASRNIAQIETITENQSEIIQLLGLVVGSVYGGYEASKMDRRKNKTKREIISYMQSKLGTKSLWLGVQHPRLSIEIASDG